MDDER
jgi:hypothetical protein